MLWLPKYGLGNYKPYVTTGDRLNVNLAIRPLKKTHCWKLEEVVVLKQYTKGFYSAKPDTDIKIHNNTQFCSQ